MTMPKTIKAAGTPLAATSSPTRKLDQLIAVLGRDDGATIDELVAATGWQKHSVRGAMSGALKRKGHAIASTKSEGVRRYKLVTKA